MRVYLRAAAWLVCLAACSGRSTRPTADSERANEPRVAATPEVDASVGGTVTLTGIRGGQPVSARSAIAVFDSGYGPGIPPVIVVGMPENFDLTCPVLKKDAALNIQHPNAVQLDLLIETGGPPIRPGVYSITSPDAGGASGAVAMTATGSYYQLDGDCGTPSLEMATSGSVVVSAIDRTNVSGSFDLAFPNGDFVTGEFSAPTCAVIVNYGGIGPPPVICTP
jgi:hypothetical protein